MYKLTAGLIGLCGAGALALTACSQPPANGGNASGPAAQVNAAANAAPPANAAVAAPGPGSPDPWTYAQTGPSTMGCAASADPVTQAGAITFCIGGGGTDVNVATLDVATGSFDCASGKTCKMEMKVDGGDPLPLTYRIVAGNPHKAAILDPNDITTFFQTPIKKLTFAIPLVGGASVNGNVDVSQLDIGKAGFTIHYD